MKKTILVTGAAGFIGMHTAEKLLKLGHIVHGIDNLNNYYSISLKKYRLSILKEYENFKFYKIDISAKDQLDQLFNQHDYNYVIHLAAQAGVRHSINKPFEYIDSNITGTMRVLESCRNHSVQHLIFASSSSVYGISDEVPLKESNYTDKPVSLYGATKKANEVMAYSYSKLYNIPITALRFFTVYGPAGRPDMAPWLFVKAATNNTKIKVFNKGNLMRDFTYIDDIVNGVLLISDVIPDGNVPYETYNLGNGIPVKLIDFIEVIEKIKGTKIDKEFIEMQEGDVYITHSSTHKIKKACGYSPKTSIESGMNKFIDWYDTKNQII